MTFNFYQPHLSMQSEVYLRKQAVTAPEVFSIQIILIGGSEKFNLRLIRSEKT